MAKGDVVNIRVSKKPPADYHCSCDYCKKYEGELRPPGGDGYYSRLERREYYDRGEQGPSGHIAKTPLHVARWAIQTFTKPGQWVLDPTLGAGTSAVEAITQGRNAAGMELQYGDILKANLAKNKTDGVVAKIRLGDARKIGAFLGTMPEVQFDLVINNPPYSGDEGQRGLSGPQMEYQSDKPNLAFLREGRAYWEALGEIYRACIDRMTPDGHFVFAVKDMMRNKKPFLLHEQIADLLVQLGLRHEGTVLLRHWPGTQHLHTYGKRYGIEPPLYQTICVFRR